MVLTWSTRDKTPSSTAEYGRYELNTKEEGSSFHFTQDTSQYIHKVTLKNLKPGEKYCK